jgi:hypothetical protein
VGGHSQPELEAAVLFQDVLYRPDSTGTLWLAMGLWLSV